MVQPALNNAIESVLLKEQFVCIPRLGSFFLKEAEATINNYTGEIKPSHSLLAFNAQLIENDGNLAHALSKELGVSYKEAMSLLSDKVDELKRQIQQKKYASFFPFGNFFLNKQGEIFFVPRQQYNLHLPNFGLQSLKWERQQKPVQTSNWSKEPIIESPAEDAVVVSFSEEHISQSENEHRSNPLWKIAASFAVISVSALALSIAVMSWIGIYNEGQQMASMSSLTTPKQSLEAPTPKQEYVYVNGKLLKLEGKAPTNNTLTAEVKDVNEIQKIEAVVEAPTSDKRILSIEEFQKVLLNEQNGQYFLVGGSYLTKRAAELECQQWNAKGLNATLFKPSGSSLLKVILGRFQTKEDVKNFTVNITGIPEGSLSMTRWNIGK